MYKKIKIVGINIDKINYTNDNSVLYISWINNGLYTHESIFTPILDEETENVVGLITSVTDEIVYGNMWEEVPLDNVYIEVFVK